MDRHQAIEFLKNRPYKFGHMLGFTKLSEIHNRWIVDMLLGKEDKTLQASRNTYKTTCVSIALALIILLLPKQRTAFFRKTDTDVKEIIAQVKKILKDPHTQYFAQVIYGVNLRLVTENATEISTNLVADIKGTAQLSAFGIGASVTGKHYDRIFTDDIVNISDRKSKADREATKLFYQELQNIKNRGGRIYNTGTPWHEDDAFKLMPAPEKYDCYHPDIAALFEPGEIEYRKENMLPSLFAANYELRFVASEMVIFREAKTGADRKLIHGGTSFLDSAFYGDDSTAWCVVRRVEGKFYVLGKIRRKHVEDCYADIITTYEDASSQKLYTEDNADKGYVAKDLRGAGLRATTYHEAQNKYIKIVTFLKAAWPDVIFVEGTDEEFIQQILDYNEDAEHDDAPDVLASAIRKIGKKDSDKYQPLYM